MSKKNKKKIEVSGGAKKKKVGSYKTFGCLRPHLMPHIV